MDIGENFWNGLLEVPEKTGSIDLDACGIDDLVRDMPGRDRDFSAGVYFDCLGNFIGILRMADCGLSPATDSHNELVRKALALGAVTMVAVRWFCLIDSPHIDMADMAFAVGVGNAAEALGITLSDVMLIGRKTYCSFCDEGMM